MVLKVEWLGAMKLCAESTGGERLGDYRQYDNEVIKSVSSSNCCVSDEYCGRGQDEGRA